MIGDTVTVQGQWQPDVAPALAMPALHDVTGVSGGDKNSLLASWQSAFQKVSWTRNILGILTLIGSILLIWQLRRTKRKNTQEEQETWPSQETKTIPTT